MPTDAIPPPILAALLPPLLAHLPAAFSSPQPPPSLLPLLAPILRNRVRLLADPAAPSWLPLLAWSAPAGAALAAHVADLDPARAPGTPTLAGIRRADAETLKAAATVPGWALEVEYTWAANDPDGEDDGWRVLDVRVAGGAAAERAHASVAAADAAFAAARAPAAAADGNNGNDDDAGDAL